MTPRYCSSRGRNSLPLNGGPHFKFTEAISFSVDCKTQPEVDEYWEKLSADGKPGQCGWTSMVCHGRSSPACWVGCGRTTPQKSKRAMEAMLKMTKLDSFREGA
jgi:predicted 3-demethylubiquinone-9 3-methyltransferase (glyoxalase superfamily)